MKTSKSNVRCRFGRLLSGILSAAMLFSAAAFQIPVSADDEVGGYEVLYDFVKGGYLEDSKLSDNGTDTITADAHWDNISLASKTFSAPITGKTVRFHFEIMHEYTVGCPKFFTAVVTDDRGFDVAGSRWLGIGEHGENAGGPYKIGYYGGRENWNITETTHQTFEKNHWYNIDTIYNLTEGKSYYYIDGVKIGEGDGPTQIMQASLRILNRGMDLGKSYYKNMMIDSGNAAQITDTNDNGATLMFTNPTALDSSNITVKCLETGETPTVTVTKVNDMKYNLSYSTGTNIGGDYMLTFSDAFAAISGISDKNVVYSQKPAAIYQQYINDDFESYNSGVTLWSKNSSINREKIEYHNGGLEEKYALSPNYSVYGAMDNDRKVIEVNLSECTEARKQKAMEMGFKYALGDYKVTEDSNGAKGNFKVSFDVKNVDNKNENVTATGDANRFALGTNAYGTFILGLSKNMLYIYTKSDGTAPNNDTPAKSVELSETDNGYHHIDILFDFTNNNQKIMADDTEYYNGVMYSTLQSRGLTYLTFMQRKCSSTWSDTNYGEAYTLIDNLNVINLDSASTSGIKSVQYSSDGINYSPAIGKVDSATKYVKIDFTSAMDTSTLSDINLSNGSNTVAATGTASNDNKTYTLELTDNLAINTDYTLNIPMSVKTADGNSLARAYTGKVTTTAGTFKIDLLDIQKNGATVTKSEIAAQDAINAVVNITNTEGREGEAYLCICVYNDDVMTQVNFDKINLKTESTKSVPITVASTANIKVKAFLWNDFATMKPLIQNKTVE
mgnify:CR=1 FL=1